MPAPVPSSVIVITGCASGIGRHLAGALAARGHRVMATDVNEGALTEAARDRRWEPSRVCTERLDVRAADDWERALDACARAFGPPDVVMNVAGYLKPAYVHEASLGDVDLHVDVNLKGVILGTRAAARRMVAARKGHIVNIGSLASLAPVPGLSLYSASKFAVRGFSLAAAQDLRPHGVFVTVVLPDAVQTPMLDLQVDYDEAALTFSGPRALTVEDIEAAIVDRVLVDRPMELALPAGRAFLARVANAVPSVAGALRPLLARAGRRRQSVEKARRRG